MICYKMLRYCYIFFENAAFDALISGDGVLEYRFLSSPVPIFECSHYSSTKRAVLVLVQYSDFFKGIRTRWLSTRLHHCLLGVTLLALPSLSYEDLQARADSRDSQGALIIFSTNVALVNKE